MDGSHWLAGVDGCRGGCFAVLGHYAAGLAFDEVRFALCEKFAQVLTLPEQPAIIAVDIPIGLLDCACPGGRLCDRAARRMLVLGRASSVFSPPLRAALSASDYRSALRLNGCGMSKQAYNIAHKIREVDQLMQPSLQRRIYEAHPELTFRALAGKSLKHNKKTSAGQRERLELLKAHFGAIKPEVLRGRFGRSSLAPDDILDAYALALTAQRIHERAAERLPRVQPQCDSKGLRMEIWY
jgi:predicted RNase H-like nuclease